MSDTISKIPFLFVGDHLLVCANKNSVEEEDRCMTLKIQVFGQQYFGMLYSWWVLAVGGKKNSTHGRLDNQ